MFPPPGTRLEPTRDRKMDAPAYAELAPEAEPMSTSALAPAKEKVPLRIRVHKPAKAKARREDREPNRAYAQQWYGGNGEWSSSNRGWRGGARSSF